MTQFITLAGKKQVGKDTSAEMLKELLIAALPTTQEGEAHVIMYPPETRIHIVHFADALKKACHIIFGIPLEDMETEEGKQKLTHVRWPADEAWRYGTDPVRLDCAVWVPGGEHVCEELAAMEFMTVRHVLQFVGTELFRNQLDPDVWLNSVFLQPWKEDDIVIIADARFPNEAALGRENGLLINVQRNTGLVDDGHKSENALGDFTDYHHTVDNNGSFDELHAQLNVILVVNKLSV